MSPPSTVTIDLDTFSDVAIGRCEGKLGLSDVENAAATMIERLDELSAPPRHMLWDLNDARLELGEAELRQLVKFVSSRAGAPRGRTAYVAGTDLAFGVMRVYQAIRSGEDDQISVFRDREEALEWLRDG